MRFPRQARGYGFAIRFHRQTPRRHHLAHLHTQLFPEFIVRQRRQALTGTHAIHPFALRAADIFHTINLRVHRRERLAFLFQRPLRARLEENLDRLERPARVLAAHPVAEERQALIARILFALVVGFPIKPVPFRSIARRPLGTSRRFAMDVLSDVLPGHASRAQLGGDGHQGGQVLGHGILQWAVRAVKTRSCGALSWHFSEIKILNTNVYCIFDKSMRNRRNAVSGITS